MPDQGNNEPVLRPARAYGTAVEAMAACFDPHRATALCKATRLFKNSSQDIGKYKKVLNAVACRITDRMTINLGSIQFRRPRRDCEIQSAASVGIRFKRISARFPQPESQLACTLRMVGAIGFEPTTYGSQNRRAAKLRHAPTILKYGLSARLARPSGRLRIE